MRIAQKKMALEFIHTLYQAHDQIKNMINKNKLDSARDMLEQCQEGAIHLGELIEKSEGEDGVTIELLEDYCENIYKVHTTLGTNENIGKLIKIIHKQLVQIENSIKNDIQQRLEVVFLPYNASMWDSLESVWKAADADQNCDPYVIPIPFYNKYPDGSFKEEYWEGDKYPDYVPITSYKDYDLEERHPDMIFIHNPYDDCNAVTSVHPYFYSRNLKELTDQLIYIPYFMLDEISPYDNSAIEGIQHFCSVPGVLNSDKVFVQSENMKQIYVSALTKLLGENTYEYWSNKIEGTGSPKQDKLLNTKQEELQIPENWLNIIQKPDGSYKKVVFYNISIGSLLENGKKMLAKIENVFSIFKENKDEIALLWRPHPLIEDTLMAMRNQLWERYKIIREEYIQEGWGIYDDSADLDRAIVISDAYYGDKSSVLSLYKQTGKPAMLQSFDLY